MLTLRPALVQLLPVRETSDSLMLAPRGCEGGSGMVKGKAGAGLGGCVRPRPDLDIKKLPRTEV